MMSNENGLGGHVWRKCSVCKRAIVFNSKYFLCSVSTCNGLRTGYLFCSVPCFERHLPGARHRDAAAIEHFAPKTATESSPESASLIRPQKSDSSASQGSTVGSSAGSSNEGRQRILIRPNSANQMPGSSTSTGGQREVLVIASRLKEYIAARADMNTSGAVMEILSDYLRVLADRGIDNARSEGRKTVMERDFEFLKKSLF